MALKTFTKDVDLGTTSGQYGSQGHLKLTVVENSIDAATNKSNVTATLQFIVDQYTWRASSASWSISGYKSASGSLVAYQQYSGTTTLWTQTFDVAHDSDGTKTISFNISFSSTYTYNGSGSLSCTLTQIPQYTTITNFTVSPRSEKSFIINWRTADTIDIVQFRYRPSGGSYSKYLIKNVTDSTNGDFSVINGHEFTDVDGGTHTISLAENTKYYVQIKVRRKDSQKLTTSDAVSVTTRIKPTQTFLAAETYITVTWSCDEIVDNVQYYLNDSSTPVDVGYANAKTGQFTITSLTPATTYKIKTSLKRAYGQVYSNTSNQSSTTCQWPYVSEVETSDLKIGNSQKVKLYNPLNRTVTLYMRQNNTSGTLLYRDFNVTGTSKTFTPDADDLYKSIKNSPSGNCVYYCEFLNHIVSTTSKTYSIKGDEKPIFSASDWGYSTNYMNPNVVVKNKSNLTVSVNSTATSPKYANMDGYTIKWGSDNDPQNLTTQTGSKTFAKGTSHTVEVIAKDKRKLSTSTTKEINMIDYFDPSGTIKTKRLNGVGETVTIKLSGSYFDGTIYTNSNTTTENDIQSITYAITTTLTNNVPDFSESTDYPITGYTHENGSFSINDYQIYSDGSSGGFTAGTTYYIRIKVQDKFRLVTTDPYNIINIDGIITDGKIAIDCYKDSNGEYHRGVNGLADDSHAEYIHGLLGADLIEQFHITPEETLIDDCDDAIHNGLYAWRPDTENRPNINYGTLIVLNSAGYEHNNRDNWCTQIGVGTSGSNYVCVRRKINSGSWTSWVFVGFGDFANYLPLAGGTLTGKLIMSSSGWETSHANGFTYDQYGNMKHKSNDTSNYWHIDANDGTQKFKVYPETGVVQATTFNGNATKDGSGNTITSTYQKLPTELYNNTSGTTGTVNLSETSANFTYLEIFFKNSDNDYNSTRVYSPNGKVVVLTAAHNNDTYLYHKTRTYTISGTSITAKTNAVQTRIGNNVATTHSTGDYIYIVRVIGYK